MMYKKLINISWNHRNAEINFRDKLSMSPKEIIQLNQTAKRPLKSGLKSDYAQNILNLEPPTIKECLETIVEQK